METHPLHQAVEEIKSITPIQIKGKAYLQVSTRISVFRKYYPDASIVTKILHDDEYRVVVQAMISVGDNILSTGLSEEFRNDGFINSTSALENSETSAIGRALAGLSLFAENGEYASSNEVANAVSQQQNYNQQSANNSYQQQNQPYQKPYQNSQDFHQLTSLGLNIVETGDKITVQGDKNTIISNKELLKSLGFKFDFNGTKQWYILLRQAA